MISEYLLSELQTIRSAGTFSTGCPFWNQRAVGRGKPSTIAVNSIRSFSSADKPTNFLRICGALPWNKKGRGCGQRSLNVPVNRNLGLCRSWSFSGLDRKKAWRRRFSSRICGLHFEFGWICSVIKEKLMHVSIPANSVLLWIVIQQLQLVFVPNNIDIFLLYHCFKNNCIAFKTFLNSNLNCITTITT